MDGIDPQAKKYVGADVMPKKQIAEVQADAKMPATGRDSYFRPSEAPSHPSPVLRAYLARAEMLCDAEDVFLAIYLFRRPEASGVEKPDQAGVV